MGVEIWDSSTVTGMILSFSVSFGVLLECGISTGGGVVLIVDIRQLLSIPSRLYGYMPVFLKVFFMVAKQLVLPIASLKIKVKSGLHKLYASLEPCM